MFIKNCREDMKRKLTFDPGFKPIIYTGDREREYVR